MNLTSSQKSCICLTITLRRRVSSVRAATQRSLPRLVTPVVVPLSGGGGGGGGGGALQCAASRRCFSTASYVTILSFLCL